MLAAGVLSGVAGGAAMAAVVVIAAAATGIAPLQPLAAIGETFVGPEALEGTAAKVALGALVHLAVSAAFGVVFAAVVPRDLPTGCAMGLGAGGALFAMGFMMSVMVPWANPGFAAAAQVMGGSWVIAHAVFGAVLGIAPRLRRSLTGQASGASSEAAPAPPRAAAIAVPGSSSARSRT